MNLSQYEALFAHMSEAFMLGDIVHDAQGKPIDFRVLMANAAFHRLTGLPPDDLGRPLRGILPQMEDVWIERYSHVVLTGEPVRFANYNADTRRHYEVYCYRPEPERFAALFRDITAQVEMQQNLREQEQQLLDVQAPLPDFRLLFEHVPGNYLVLSPELVILDASNSYLQSTMTRRKDLIGLLMFDAFPDNPDDPDATGVANLRASLERVIATGRADTMAVQKYDVRRPIDQGGAFEERYWRPFNCPVPGPDGNLRYIIHRVEDVTEIVHLQQQGHEQKEIAEELKLQRDRIAHELLAHERELAARASELSQMIAALPGLVWTATAKATADFLSPQWGDYSGLPTEQLLGEGWLDIVHPDDRAPTIVAWRAAVEKQSPFREDYRVRRHDGKYHWFQVRGQPLHDEAGEFLRWFGICTDIDDLKQALAALALSEAELRATFEQAGVGILYVNREGGLIKVNPKICAMLGYAPNEWSTLHMRDIVLPDDEEQGQAQFERAMSGKIDGYIAELRYLHKDGHVVWVRITASPVRDPDSGEVRYIAKFIEDISERKRARAELEGFFGQATVGLTVKDAESRMLRLNQRLSDMLGYPKDALQGKLYLTIVHPDDLPLEQKLYERLLAGEIPEYSMETRLRCMDGSYVWIMTSATLIRDAAENPSLIACVVHDIEARKQLEAELRGTQRELEERVEHRTRELRLATWQAEEALRAAEAANQAKSQFLATMSHEIRTPLNGVIGFTGLLLDGSLTEEKRRYAELARQSGEALLHLLNDFLDFSKIEAGRLALEPVDFDLHQELQQVLALVQPGADEKSLELRRNIKVPRRFRGDAARLRQILLNLLTNALKFTREGHVTLCCTESSREGTQMRICFEVIDTGMGIDPATRAQLFQPFTQANGVSRRFGGTGLGLAICRRLTELMGGEIGFRSKPGEGSTFWLELPFEILPSADDPLPMNPAEAFVAVPAGGCRGRVLVAEDNSVSQQLASEVFKRLGCQVDVVGNGREAVEAYKRLPYDLILMDCDMPVMDGFEATSHIRALEADSDHHVPIVAMTASALQGDAERCLAVGMDEFMSKPLRLMQLSQVIDTWLKPA